MKISSDATFAVVVCDFIVVRKYVVDFRKYVEFRLDAIDSYGR